MHLTWHKTQLICWTLYHVYLRSWEGDGTMSHARAAAAGRAVGAAYRASRIGGQAACVDGMGRERFSHFLFNAKSCHKCWSTSSLGNCAAGALSPPGFGLLEIPYVRPRLVILRVIEKQHAAHRHSHLMARVIEKQHAAHRHSHLMACTHRTLGE
jgi:hypothetical protein